jgi:hypothetical protein
MRTGPGPDRWRKYGCACMARDLDEFFEETAPRRRSVMKHVVVAVIAVVSMSWVAPTFAQQSPAPAPAPKAEVAMGELVRVDTTAKTISVRPEKGDALVFTYNDATKVSGAGDVAGLATMSGSQVTVHYAKQGQTNLASQIEVQKKAS